VTTRTARGRAWLSTIAFLCVVALLVVAALAFALNRPSANRYAALLQNAIGLYPGADVRVLGVPVGRITGVTPQGQLVRVDFEVNRSVKVPADAKAVIVVPTVVADRFLQLAPVYNGGPTLLPDAVIPPERTAVPAEYDDLLAAVQKLSTSLGPRGVNANGALSDALHTFAANLNGNGDRFNIAVSNTAQAITTLSASREDLAGTVRNLQSFTTNLKQNDAQVRAFTHQFAEVGDFLADERQDLGAALHELSIALGEVAKFIRDNRRELRIDVDRLADILSTVNAERLALEQALDGAQSGLDNLVNGYNASSGTLDTRSDLLASLLCAVYGLFSAAPPVQALLAQLISAAFPGSDPLAGCSNTSALKLPNLDLSQLANLKLPTLPLRAGQQAAAAPALPGIPGLSAPQPGPSQPGQSRADQSSADRRAPAKDSETAPKTRKPRSGPPSLGSLFGGGE
jgi:virulence factor Mce-like protein